MEIIKATPCLSVYNFDIFLSPIINNNIIGITENILARVIVSLGELTLNKRNKCF